MPDMNELIRAAAGRPVTNEGRIAEDGPPRPSAPPDGEAREHSAPRRPLDMNRLIRAAAREAQMRPTQPGVIFAGNPTRVRVAQRQEDHDG